MAKKGNKKRADGRIAIQIYLGKDENGKAKRKTVYGKTQKEAERKAAELKRQLGKGLDLTVENDTFGFWADLFVKSKANETSVGQTNMYRAKVEYFTHWQPSKKTWDEDMPGPLATTSIGKIKLFQLQEVLDTLAACNPYTGKPTAKRTLNTVRRVCIDVYNYALYNRVIDFNPAERLTIKQNAPLNERQALSSEQQQWIVNTPHRAQLPEMLMMYAGLRRGEVAALLWSDIDFESKTISVNKSYNFKECEIKGTKTAAGMRTVPMPDVLVDFLKRQPKIAALVVTDTAGGQTTEGSWGRLLKNYITELNYKYSTQTIKQPKRKTPIAIDTFTWHCLRHTYATILYDAGVDVLTAKKLLGHSDVKTTLGIYTHLSSEKEGKDISKLNNYMNNKSYCSRIAVNEE